MGAWAQMGAAQRADSIRTLRICVAFAIVSMLISFCYKVRGTAQILSARRVNGRPTK
jgi:hypothetical protein